MGSSSNKGSNEGSAARSIKILLIMFIVSWQLLKNVVAVDICALYIFNCPGETANSEVDLIFDLLTPPSNQSSNSPMHFSIWTNCSPKEAASCPPTANIPITLPIALNILVPNPSTPCLELSEKKESFPV